MSKGMELPVSVIVIISLAVLVLVAIGLFFLENVGRGEQGIASQSALFQACTQFRAQQLCDRARMPADLKQACGSEGWTEDGCLVACGCLTADQLPAGTQLRKEGSSPAGDRTGDRTGGQQAQSNVDIVIWDA